MLSALTFIVRLQQSAIQVQGLPNRKFASNCKQNPKHVLMLLRMGPEALA